MEQFEDAGAGQDARQVGGVRPAERDLDQMGGVVAVGKLHQAKPVAAVVQAHGLGVYRDHLRRLETVRQITLVYEDSRLDLAHLPYFPSDDRGTGPRR